MYMIWTLLVVSITGTFTQDVKYHSIPMSSKNACVKAGEWASKNSSSGIGFICVSSETGEVVRILK